MEKFLADPEGAAPVAAIGRHHPCVRMVWALPLLGSGLSRRFSALAPGESSLFGMDFSFVLAPDVAIASATVQAFANTFAAPLSGDLATGPVTIEGTRVHARLSGGVAGADYQLLFTAVDTDGNTWPRTALVLCSATS